MDGRVHIYQAVVDTMQTVIRQQPPKKVDEPIYIYPHDLLGWLPFHCSEWTIRRYCRDMAAKSVIIPLEGNPLRVERRGRKGGYTIVAAA